MKYFAIYSESKQMPTYEEQVRMATFRVLEHEAQIINLMDRANESYADDDCKDMIKLANRYCRSKPNE